MELLASFDCASISFLDSRVSLPIWAEINAEEQACQHEARHEVEPLEGPQTELQKVERLLQQRWQDRDLVAGEKQEQQGQVEKRDEGIVREEEVHSAEEPEELESGDGDKGGDGDGEGSEGEGKEEGGRAMDVEPEQAEDGLLR